MDRLIQHGIKINPAKSKWARSEVQYLGNVYNETGCKPAPGLVDKINKFPEPTDLTSLKRVLGAMSYYRNYILKFSDLAKPLLELNKSEVSFKWTTECAESFRTLKEKLTTYPVLRYPVFDRPFHIHTDASNFAIGAQLCQVFEDGLHPIGYYSRVLNKSEKNYSVYEKEGLAVVAACKHFRHFILGHETIITTDHSPLRWLLTCDHKNSRLAKFSLKLQEYNLKIMYKPGKENYVADALSRIEVGDCCVIGMTSECLASTQDDLLQFSNQQLKDPFLKQILSMLSNNASPLDLSSIQHRHVQSQKRHYLVRDGVLYYNPPEAVRPLLCVPETMKFDILNTYHNSLFGCHVGRNRLYKRLCKKYYWLGMSKDVGEYVSACIQCNQRKRGPVTPVFPLQPLETEDKPFARVHFDILGPLPLTERGNKYILGLQCSFSKFVIMRPLPDHKMETIVDCLIEYLILPHGSPNIMVSDNAAEFISGLMNALAKALNIDKRTCTPYMASTNGQVERSFQSFSNLMATMINKSQTNWDTLSKYVAHSYNNTENSSTGFTPTYLSCGREIAIPFELAIPVVDRVSYNESKNPVEEMHDSLKTAWILARDNLELAQANYKFYHDLNKNGHDYRVGDIVYVKVPRVATGNVKKFSSPYHGPYVIVSLNGLNADVRALGMSGLPIGTQFTTHLVRLKKAKAPLSTTEFTPAEYVSVKKVKESADSATATSPSNQPTAVDQQTGASHTYNLRPRQ